jgi:anti-repressor protein
MNGFEIWDYKGIEVRTIEKDGEPWWVLADVCKVLELSNSRNVSARLEDDEKGVTSVDTLGGIQKMTIINESGLYAVILRSDKPQAKPFRKWVTSEVLPTIRKTGSYAVQQKQDSYTITDPIKRAERWIEEQKEKQALEDTVAVQAQQIAELQPKSNYCDVVLRCNGTVPISVIAKDYGKSAVWLNRYLHEANVQYKQNGTWLLYQKYAACGYTKTSTITDLNGESHVHTKWTQKGRLFIYDLLKNNGVLPLIELDA